uniref:Plasminogen receptor, C-terminal lysine transmembrane protein n=1 Tax=Oryzias melastigma TaxID=30732 RepID=A0A3B3B4T3_ORYME
MGFILSKSMDANFHKQQEFMLHNSRLQLERQIMMQNQMRERQMAMQIAWSREFLKYFGSFFALASVGLTAGALKRRNPALLAPIIPLGFIYTYQMDSAYGTLLYRMRGNAHNFFTPIAIIDHSDWLKMTFIDYFSVSVHNSKDFGSSVDLPLSNPNKLCLLSFRGS